MHREFQRFIDLLSVASDRHAFLEAITVTATALDLPCFAYLALTKEPLVISTYPPNWVAHYVRNSYERLDPVILQALQTGAPFRWGQGVSTTYLSPAQHELFEEASQFGIRSGFTVPIHDGRGPVAALTFASDQRSSTFNKCIDSNERALPLIALYFHAHVRSVLRNDHSVDGIRLSPREFECLEWSSRGKSAWEIGSILGISRRTAAFHLDNARAKLGVRTVRQAVVRLAESRYRR